MILVPYKVGGLFSGVGGIELGFQRAGFKISWANENDPYCNQTYQTNFNHRLISEDVRNLDPNDLEPIDILVAGFPCQPFSLAGNRKGFDDDRGNIFFDIIRIIKGLKQRPKVVFLENVKNFNTHDNENTLKRVRTLLRDDLNYSFFNEVLNSHDYTVIPQNRERTFIICFDGEKNWEQSKKDSLSKVFSDNFPPKTQTASNSFRKYLEDDVHENYFYTDESYNINELKESVTSEETVYQWRRVYVRENKKGLCPTLTANMGTGGHNVPIIKDGDRIRKLTPRECFNLQGYGKNFKLPEISNSALYKQAGNSVCVPLIEKLAKIIKGTLKA